MSGKRVYGSCPYNDGIDCEKRICDRGGICGWFPMVDHQRRIKLKRGEIPQPDKKEKESKFDDRHRAFMREYSAERRKRLKADGLCPTCGKPNDRNAYCCTACMERQKALRKAKDKILL